MAPPGGAVTARRVLRGARIVLAVVVAATLVDLAPPAARAQDAEPGLAGYQGRAAASGLHAMYNPAGLLPLPPPVDLGAPDALATIASGPSTFARASVLDPGDLLASPDALLAQASTDYPAGAIPPYPFRVSATSGVGEPAVESNPAPGLHARVEVGDGTSLARATMPALDAPAVATVGSMSAVAGTETDGSQVTVHARVELSGIDILGLVKISSVVTDLTATSSGGDAELTGGTTVVGAEVLGQAVRIDADGVHPAGSPSLLGGLLDPLVVGVNDILGQVGIDISVAGPVRTEGGSTDELATNGLRIGMELSPRTLPALAQLIGSLPPLENPVPGAPSVEDLLALAQARHLVAVELGRGSVSLLARTGAPLGDSVPLGPTGSVDLPSTTPSFSLPDTAGPSIPPATDAPTVPTEPVSIPKGAGMGAAVLLVLLSMPFVGDRIARICAAVLATDRSTTCTRRDDDDQLQRA